jgi:hypothetical protein
MEKGSRRHLPCLFSTVNLTTTRCVDQTMTTSEYSSDYDVGTIDRTKGGLIGVLEALASIFPGPLALPCCQQL